MHVYYGTIRCNFISRSFQSLNREVAHPFVLSISYIYSCNATACPLSHGLSFQLHASLDLDIHSFHYLLPTLHTR